LQVQPFQFHQLVFQQIQLFLSQIEAIEIGGCFEAMKCMSGVRTSGMIVTEGWRRLKLDKALSWAGLTRQENGGTLGLHTESRTKSKRTMLQRKLTSLHKLFPVPLVMLRIRSDVPQCSFLAPQVLVYIVANVQSKLVEDCPKNGILETRVF
jgi:hypothetical protein